MTRAITALVALFAVKLQACTAFQHSKVQSNRAMSPDAQLVGYLSQHTTHAVLQAKPEIDALMAK